MTSLISTESTPPESSSTAHGDLSTSLRLHLVRPEDKQQQWELLPGRCTLGSSSRCQIHLPGEQVRPLHCLIVHNEQGTNITRWAAGALLNGQDFTTAPLRPGDRLTIGEIELELLTGDATLPNQDRKTNQQGDRQQGDREEFSLSKEAQQQPAGKSTNGPCDISSHWEADRLVSHLWSANFSARTRCRKLLESLRSEQTIEADLQRTIETLQDELRSGTDHRDRIASELSELQTAASTRDGESAAELDRLIDELNSAYEKISVTESVAAEHAAQSERFNSEIIRLSQDFELASGAHAEAMHRLSEFSEQLAERDQGIEQLQQQLTEVQQFAAQNLQAEQEAGWEAVNRLECELTQLQEERDHLASVESQHAEKIGHLEARSEVADQLEHDLNQLREERDRLASVETQQSEKVGQLESALGDHKRQLEELRGEHERVCQALHTFEEGAFEQVDAYKRLEEELAEVCSSRDELAASQAEHGQRSHQLEQDLAERDQQIEQMRGKLSSTLHIREELEQEAAQYLATRQTLQEEIEELNSRCEQMAERLSCKEEEQSASQQLAAEQQQQVDELTAQLELAQEESRQLQGTFDDKDELLRRREAELDQLRAEKQDLSEQHAAEFERRQHNDQCIAEKQQRVELLEVDLNSTQSELKQAAQAVARLEKERSEADHQIAALQDELTTRAHEWDKGFQDEAQLREERDLLTEKLQATEQEIVQQRQHSEQVAHDLREAQELLAVFEQDKVLFNAQADEKSELVNQLTEELEAARNQFEECLTRQKEFEALAEESLSELARLNAQSEEKTALTGQLTEELETARKRFEESQTQRDEFEALYNNSQRDLEALNAQPEEESTLADQLTEELETAREQFAESRTQREKFESLYYESQRDLAAARECLVSAEQALQKTEQKNSPQTASDDQNSHSSESEHTAEEAIEHLREMSVWSEEGSQPVAEDDSVANDENTASNDFEPTSFIEQYSHMLDEDSSNLESTDTHEPTAHVTNPEPLPEDTDDAALEAYMSNLMQRVRGGETSASTEIRTQIEEPVKSDSEPAASVEESSSIQADEPVESGEEYQEPLGLEDLKKSSSKPPLPTDLLAMRDLANSSARGAIAKHSARLHKESAFTHLLISGVSTGVALTLLLAAESYQSTSFIVGACFAGIGLVWGAKLLGNLFSAIRAGSWRHAAPAEIELDDDALPIAGNDEVK